MIPSISNAAAVLLSVPCLTSGWNMRAARNPFARCKQNLFPTLTLFPQFPSRTFHRRHGAVVPISRSIRYAIHNCTAYIERSGSEFVTLITNQRKLKYIDLVFKKASVNALPTHLQMRLRSSCKPARLTTDTVIWRPHPRYSLRRRVRELVHRRL